MCEQAAKVLKLSAPEVKGLGVIDDIVREPQGGAHRNHEEAATLLGNSISKHLEKLLPKDGAELVKERIARFRKMGTDYIVSADLDR